MDRHTQEMRDIVQAKIDKKESIIKQLLGGEPSFIQIDNKFSQGQIVELSNSIQDLQDILERIY